MHRTPHELVDIVNPSNKVVDQATKIHAHTHGLLHRTIIAGVKKTNGDWVLVKQASDRQDPGQWVSPVGGHVRAGESEIDAMKREVLEEIGLNDYEISFLGRAIYSREVIGRKENHYFIVYEIVTDEDFTLNHEAIDYKAFNETELRKLLKDAPDYFGDAYHFVVQRFYPHFLE